MQPIISVDPRVGSFAWVLPENTIELLDGLSEEERDAARTNLSLAMTIHLHILLAAIRLGGKADAAFSHIRASDIVTVDVLRRLARL